MSDNVVKFRKIEKKPDPKAPKPPRELPGWAPFAGLIALALVIYAVQNAGLIGS